MKKLTALLLAVLMVFSLAACAGGGDGGSKGEISVFYYNFGDTYISSVRAAMDKILDDSGRVYNDYDAANNQTTQTEQVATAIAKGSKLLIVNVVDTGSKDAAMNIIDQAKQADIPVIFFNRSVDEDVVTSYEKCIFVGTDYEMAGHMQGQMIGEYLVKNFDTVDLNKDGKISYVMFKGQEGNMEAIARTQFGVEDCNKVLKKAGKADLVFYDAKNEMKYLVDQNGQWSAEASTNYMKTLLSNYNEKNNNMVELVIANNDEMALGAISALQEAGYNKQGGKVIPVFGVDAIPAAQAKINEGSMIGTIKQDADGMANVISTIAFNFLDGKDAFETVPAEQLVGKWRVNIPYATFTK